MVRIWICFKYKDKISNKITEMGKRLEQKLDFQYFKFEMLFRNQSENSY